MSKAASAVWRHQHPVFLERLPPGQELPHLELTVARLPRIAADRLSVAMARRAQGGEDVPWITADAIRMLDTLLHPSDQGLEFGFGGSTIWLARRSKEVRTVEASQEWFAEAGRRFAAASIDNAQITLADEVSLGVDTPAHRDAYVHAYPELAPGSLDWVFVDGEYRDECVRRGIELLRPGGLLVIDNINTYLPGPTRSPLTVHEPATDLWRQLQEQTLSRWRMIWTTNGVWDTAMWFKPST